MVKYFTLKKSVKHFTISSPLSHPDTLSASALLTFSVLPLSISQLSHSQVTRPQPSHLHPSHTIAHPLTDLNRHHWHYQPHHVCTNPSSLLSCTALDLMTILSFWWLPDLASVGLRFSEYVLSFLGFNLSSWRFFLVDGGCFLAGFSNHFFFFFLVFPIWIFGWWWLSFEWPMVVYWLVVVFWMIGGVLVAVFPSDVEFWGVGGGGLCIGFSLLKVYTHYTSLCTSFFCWRSMHTA